MFSFFLLLTLSQISAYPPPLPTPPSPCPAFALAITTCVCGLYIYVLWPISSYLLSILNGCTVRGDRSGLLGLAGMEFSVWEVDVGKSCLGFRLNELVFGFCVYSCVFLLMQSLSLPGESSRYKRVGRFGDLWLLLILYLIKAQKSF